MLDDLESLQAKIKITHARLPTTLSAERIAPWEGRMLTGDRGREY
jgi:hypothetical protein